MTTSEGSYSRFWPGPACRRPRPPHGPRKATWPPSPARIRDEALGGNINAARVVFEADPETAREAHKEVVGAGLPAMVDEWSKAWFASQGLSPGPRPAIEVATARPS